MKKAFYYLLIAVAALAATSCDKEKKYPTAPDKPAAKEPEAEVVVPTDIVFRLAGDSTCAAYKEEQRPQMGWGECFAEALGEGVQVANYAVGGESTKSFYDSGKWAAMMEETLAGDVVLIQFGHNDSKDDAEHATKPNTTYKEYLTTFINDVRAKGAVPVLLTSICRRSFRSGGAPNRSHGDYPKAVRELASETGTAIVDAEELTYMWLVRLGEQKSANYYVVYKRGAEDPDNTHLCTEGAQEVAAMIAKELKKVAPWVVEDSAENTTEGTTEGTTEK